MKRRNAADLDLLTRQLGTDLRLNFAGLSGWWEDADLAAGGPGRELDLGTVSGIQAAEQMLVNRLKTRKGELAALGHPDYGSRHHELIGEPNVERTRNLIKLYVLEMLRSEPRVEKVLACAVHAGAPPQEQVRIEVELMLIDNPNPLNLVVPFSLGVAL